MKTLNAAWSLQGCGDRTKPISAIFSQIYIFHNTDVLLKAMDFYFFILYFEMNNAIRIKTFHLSSLLYLYKL